MVFSGKIKPLDKPAAFPGGLDEDFNLNSAIESLNRQWNDACLRLTPHSSGSQSIWRYSRPPLENDPEQGWKLHISATILSAGDILVAIAPVLRNQNILFKAPVNLHELMKINAGIFYGYHQIGKIFTVYPPSDELALLLADQLHRLTYFQSAAPRIPYDLRFKNKSCVYYRYGSFRTIKKKGVTDTPSPLIKGANGELISDLRDSGIAAAPPWARNPFRESCNDGFQPGQTPLNKTYKAVRALSQRGKSGVFRAIDFSRQNPRFCLLKEGRRNGETEWDGRDGFWRVRHEKKVLNLLRISGVKVPEVYASFEAENNYYLVTEFLEGETLLNFLIKGEKRLSFTEAAGCGRQLASLLAEIHRTGWIWRDCKPTNLIINNGKLRPIDFEGASPVNTPDPLPWGTPSFTAPELKNSRAAAGFSGDLYSLGVIFWLLFTGELPPEEGSPSAVFDQLSALPPHVSRLISLLLSPAPANRPSALVVVKRLGNKFRLLE